MIEDKLKSINNFFKRYNKAAVSFSGGVDSSVLLFLAKSNNADVKAYYIKSDFQPRFELRDAITVSDSLDIELEIINIDVLNDNRIASNPENRCYFCKKAIFNTVISKAKSDGYNVVFDGTNASDDINDRPGYKALRELGVLSPLRLFGFSKKDIRFIANKNSIAVADKPSYSCLATRISTGTQITKELLEKTENAENELMKIGFSDFRVRYLNGDAKLQITDSDIPLLIENREKITAVLKKYYRNILFDLKTRKSNE